MINCVWSEQPLSADDRAHYALNTLVNLALDQAELGLIHRNGFRQLPSGADGAVVVIHGGHEAPNANELLCRVKYLPWSLVIVTGDEEGVFPTERFTGPRRKVWHQMPIPEWHDHVDRRLICGYAHDTPAYLLHCEREMRDRPLNWFFAGQVNHAWRRQCVAQLKMMRDGFLFESPGFWTGLPRDEYHRRLASCKVAPCPTGAATPDTLRVAEAIESGCVPIVEDRWPPGFPRRGISGHTGAGAMGYWAYVFGEKPPFPTLTDWAAFPALYEQALAEWPVNRDRLQEWWRGYKKKMCDWMTEDVNAVRAG